MSVHMDSKPPFTAETGVLLPGKEECIAIEIELLLTVGQFVDEDRHQLLLDEVRDELHRALQVPLRQIFILQDSTSRNGIFQIGILHPSLVPTKAQKKAQQSFMEMKTSSEVDYYDIDVDLELLDNQEDLGKMWDRLILFLYGGLALHRKDISNAFPLLRSKRRDLAALRWRSATIVPLETRQML